MENQDNKKSKEIQDNPDKCTILVVDDTPENIDVLDGVLNQDYKIIVALNGKSAIKLAKAKKPNLILLDVMMPEMDGYQACKILKEDEETKKIPVIFVTAKSDVESEIRGFTLGAVDYITKPISPPIVKERVNTHLKIQKLMVQLEKEKEIVEKANKQMINEQHIAKTIYDKMVHKGCLERSNIKHILWPMDIFAGDLLLATVGPNKNLYIFLGDFTGHGLTASVGVMPTTETFYTMSKKGYNLGTIMMEVNKKLNESLPIGMFCASCALEIDTRNNLLSLWNGWNPDVLLVDAKGNLRKKFTSNHMPLGLKKYQDFDSSIDTIFLEKDDRLYVYSDGITEAKGPDGGMFTLERVEAVFKEHKDPNSYFEEILRRVQEYRGDTPQSDDITMVEYHNIALSDVNEDKKLKDKKANEKKEEDKK